jgi:SAM-dependent methyltransferase
MNPNIKIQHIQHTLRQIGLLPIVEKLRFALSVFKYQSKNKSFIMENPQFELPPQALAYDAYSAPDWYFYKKSGLETAIFLANIAKKYLHDVVSPRVLEWGCGPGRVIRHIPLAFPTNTKIYGSDYNQATITWCNKKIPQINFVLNELQPPLAFEDGFFDFIYSISVFTHLSEEVSRQWIADLFRIARTGAILVITTNGDSRRNFLLPDELKTYHEKGVVIRDKVEEGKKMFFACHSPQYLTQVLFKSFEVLEHTSAAFPHTGQDYWILRKPSQQ